LLRGGSVMRGRRFRFWQLVIASQRVRANARPDDRRCEAIYPAVIPGRERSERTRNLEIPGSVLRTAPE